MTTDTRETAELQVVREPERAAALLDPERRRLVEALIEDPDSASGLARRLGGTRQQVNYHLRALERLDLVELHEERRKGNCFERVMRSSARRFVVDPGVLGSLGAEPSEMEDRFSATYVVALGARAVREVAAVMQRGREERKRVATSSIEAEVRLAHPDSFRSMTRELADAVARVVAKYHDEHAPAGRSFRLIAAVYPRPVQGRGTQDAGGAP